MPSMSELLPEFIWRASEMRIRAASTFISLMTETSGIHCRTSATVLSLTAATLLMATKP